MVNITLTSSMRNNLGSLKAIQSQMNRTQERLATGKKVNSAIDNASSYYQARSLTNRAADLNALLDSMGQGIQTIQTASTGLDTALNLVDQLSTIAMSAAEKAEGKDITITRDVDLTLHDLWDGKANTQKIVDALGDNGGTMYAAKAAQEYYAVSADEKGSWYLPSLGELMDVYGYDYNAITSMSGTSGGTPAEGKNIINKTLNFLKNSGADAQALTNNYHWSSSEYGRNNSWNLIMGEGYRVTAGKIDADDVRGFQLLENIIDSAAEKSDETITLPEFGDIVYDDNTWSKADEAAYATATAAGKTAKGVVTWVSDSGASVKIMSLKNIGRMQWSGYGTDIQGLKNYSNEPEMLNIFHGIGDGSITRATGTTEEVIIGTTADLSEEIAQFNGILAQFDTLIQDSSYQGINLLNKGTLNITFNEDRSHTYSVIGKDMSASGMGVNTADWHSTTDIQASIGQLQSAITQMRGFSEVLGNSYSIIQTRENFTDGLIDVLETGADNLVLADMNEESADYLSLQVRSNLAINALSLASQSAQNVLKLF